MKVKIVILLIGALIGLNSMFAQSIKSETNEPMRKKIIPFIGVGFVPPIYLSISAGLEIGNDKDNTPLYGTIYAKAGNFAIETTFHSYFIEVTFKLKTISI